MKHTIVSAQIIRTIQYSSTGELLEKLQKWDFHDIAQALLSSDSTLRLFIKLPPEMQSEVIFLLPEKVKESIIKDLKLKNPAQSPAIVEAQGRILKEKQENVREILQFASETAGELMKDTYVIIKDNFTMADVAKRVDSYLINHKGHDEVPAIIVVDPQGVVLGRVHLARLITSDKDQKIAELISPVPIVKSDIDQEEVISIIHRDKRDDIVVAVDDHNRPIGVIHATDLLKVMQQEATEDLYQFAGVHSEEKAVEPIRMAVKHRYKWLIVNLATAFTAATVVSVFEDTLARIVILAAYMPIVAGMGGNAGTQTLAVVVRGIATGQIEKGEGKKVVLKEIGTGLINGLIVGLLVTVIAFMWHGNLLLGFVLAVAMVTNMLAAGFFGTVIPLTLQKFNVDPAVSSSVFLTTVTDVLGFFVFLGLASIFL